MRELDDIRGAFAILEDRADDYLLAAHPMRSDFGGRHPARPGGPAQGEPVLVPEPPRGRPLQLVAVVAAVVLATAGVVALLLGRPMTRKHVSSTADAASAPPQAPSYRTLPLRSLVFGVDRPSARVTATYAGRDYQSATLTESSGLTFTITVHADTAQQPYARTGTAPVDVNGRRGVYGVVEAGPTDSGDSGVAWQYGRAEWATVRGDYGELSRSQALAIARAVRFDARPFLTPVAIDLPSVHIRDWVARTDGAPYASIVMRDDGHDVQVSCRREPATRTGDTTDINGRTAYWSHKRTVLDIQLGGGYSMTVLTVGGGASQVRAVALASTPTTSPGNVETWLPANSALPR